MVVDHHREAAARSRRRSETADYRRPLAQGIPGALWRTPAAKPGDKQLGQYIFRQDDGTLDVRRYEKFLGEAGVRNDHHVVVYGNHAERADGSVPATLLQKLGHKDVAFLDGVGADEWKAAGLTLSTEPRKLEPSAYVAKPSASKLWSKKDVLKHINDKDVVFLDSRSEQEYLSTDLKGNNRGGHIPGAKWLNYEDFLDTNTKTTIAFSEARNKVEKLNIPKDKTVVIFCQTGTRCSLKELVFKDLGYENVVLYDASWQKYGNSDEVPIETAPPQPKAP